MTQDGLAAAAWVDLRHLAQYVRPLIRDGQVRERMAHVRGARQRRKVYDLTVEDDHSFTVGWVLAHNCYVIPVHDDSIESIFEWMKQAARTYSLGGGVGTDISILRPRGAPVNNAARSSTGSVSFMELFSLTTGTIGQSGRRGALMITIADSHPDVLDFIKVKRNLDKVRYANISIRISDAFMRAVEEDGTWDLVFSHAAIQWVSDHQSLVPRLLVPFTSMGVASAALALAFYLRRARSVAAPAAAREVPLTNPFSLTEAAKFAALFAVVLLVVKAVQNYLPHEGFYVVAALAGLTDVDAITLSMAEYGKSGDPNIAITSIVIAALANTLVKAAMVTLIGGALLRRAVLGGTVAILAAGGFALLLV